MKIQLIVPALKGFKYPRKSGCPPLGLASIAAYLRMEIPNIEISCYDGEMMSNTQIINGLESDSVVGILTKTPNYPGAVEIAEVAKRRNCIVIMGGVYASAMAEAIIKYRSETVDFVVKGFGEKPILQIIKTIKQKKRMPNRIITYPAACFDNIPGPDRKIFNMERYIQDFYSDRPTWKHNYRGTNIFTHMGCIYKCDFCSRMGPLQPYYRNPVLIWDEIRGLVEKYKINYLIDFSDGITQNIPWLRWLVNSRPADIPEIKWQVFSTAGHISEETLRLLKALGVVHIFVGIETGDPKVARQICKGSNFSPDMVFAKSQMIARVGMTITPSFVYALRGDTSKSMGRTYSLAMKLKKEIGFEEVFACELIPFPGSNAWATLRKLKRYDTDILYVENLKMDWMKYALPHLDPLEVRECVDKTLELGIYPISVQGEK
ncbi:MAG: B12-binding domain-containing radical SAM protein [Elusimicrobia bacterium]|nr:B12-binding domain-containing radical SAM protein [Elusimicrobiota bacterium]